MHEAELRPYIEACQLGERRAQRYLFERYYRLMFGVCLRYMSDRDAVQDVVQEGFLKVFNNIGGYTFKGSFEGWMRRIMVNTAIDAIRRRNASGWVLGDEQSIEPADHEEGWEMEEDRGATYGPRRAGRHGAFDAHVPNRVQPLCLRQPGAPRDFRSLGHQCWNFEVEPRESAAKPSRFACERQKKRRPCRVSIHLMKG